MHMHWACPDGHVIHGDGEDEIVARAQEHMRTAHGQELSREEVLQTARGHEH